MMRRVLEGAVSECLCLTVLAVLLVIISADAAPRTPDEIYLKPEKQIYAFDIPIEPAVSMATRIVFSAVFTCRRWTRYSNVSDIVTDAFLQYCPLTMKR